MGKSEQKKKNGPRSLNQDGSNQKDWLTDYMPIALDSDDLTSSESVEVKDAVEIKL